MNAIVERLKDKGDHEAASALQQALDEVVRLRECADNLSFPVIPNRNYSKPHPTRIPWHIADLAYSKYAALYGRGQSLERLAERGGFHVAEMDDLLPDWIERVAKAMSYHDEREQLRARVAELEHELRLRQGEVENKAQIIVDLRAELKELEAAMQGELDEMREDKMYAELESEIDFMLDEPEDDSDDEPDFGDDDDVSDSGELPPEVQAQLDAMKKMARDAGIEVEGDDE